MLKCLKYSLLFFILCACKEPVAYKLSPITSWKLGFEEENTYNRTKGTAHKGFYYTHADHNSPYTAGIIYKLPDSLQGHFVRVCVDFYARIDGRRFGQSLVVSMQRQNEILFWETFDINSHTFSKKKWVHVVDSTQFFFQMPNTEGLELKVFGFNSYKKGVLDIDDLNITLKKVDKQNAIN